MRVADIAGAVRLLMSGEDQISTFKEGAEQYPVTMRLLPGQRDDPAALSRLLVPSAKLGLIRLDSVAQLERGLGPSRIDRYNRQFSVGIYGNVAPGHSLSEAAADDADSRAKNRLAARIPDAVFRAGEDSRGDHHQHDHGLSAGVHLHVHGVGGAVREPGSSVHHHADAARCRSPSLCSP